MAFVDGLTGLRNRRYLDSWIEQRLRSQNRHPSAEAVAILFADVDHFKNFNGELWAREALASAERVSGG